MSTDHGERDQRTPGGPERSGPPAGRHAAPGGRAPRSLPGPHRPGQHRAPQHSREYTGRQRREQWAYAGAAGLAAAVLIAVAAVAVPRMQGPVDAHRTFFPWKPACSVEVGSDGSTVALTREQAKTATTAVALQARGEEPPDTSGVPDLVMQRLAEGPSDDAGPTLTCSVTPPSTLDAEDELPMGLTPRAKNLLDEMGGVFGDQSVGGYEPGGYDTGHGEGSAHYDGRALDVFFRPVNEEHRREGWLVANWLLAHAPELEVAVIIFDDKIWNSEKSLSGWRDYEAADPDNEILRHLDHVHVDVLEGSGSSDA
ncbi:hypothetical protein [Nocardiopsis coralliicola]